LRDVGSIFFIDDVEEIKSELYISKLDRFDGLHVNLKELNRYLSI